MVGVSEMSGEPQTLLSPPSREPGRPQSGRLASSVEIGPTSPLIARDRASHEFNARRLEATTFQGPACVTPRADGKRAYTCSEGGLRWSGCARTTALRLCAAEMTTREDEEAAGRFG